MAIKWNELTDKQREALYQFHEHITTMPVLLLAWRACPVCGTPAKVEQFYDDWGLGRATWSPPDMECRYCGSLAEFDFDGSVRDVRYFVID